MAKKIGIIYAEYNSELTEKMYKNALLTAKQLGLEVIKTVKVPGTLEIPFALKRLLQYKEIDAVATLGVVIKGDTDHDELVAYTAASKIIKLSLHHNKPVSIGIIGPNASKKAAKKRIYEYSSRAIETIYKMLRI